ncbi:MAG TPA: hypothetical protein VE360_00870, partial [Pyrinomonadaceae bacterium]|nr:hypothetical protein [Pyrinomonadaceae bacterium]
MDGPDAADELREFRVCINRQSADEVSVGRALTPRPETLPRRSAGVTFVGEVERCAFRQRAPRRSFNLAPVGARDHDGEVRANEFQKAVALNQNPRGLDAFERQP